MNYPYATFYLEAQRAKRNLLHVFEAEAARPDFGPNVTIFDPSMPGSAIQSAFDAVQATQAPPVTGKPYTSGTGQFNTVRHAFLFKPGSYSR